MRRFTSTGNARPHIVHTGYRHESPQWAKLERPEGEPSLFVGTLIVLGGFAVIALIVTVIS